MPNVNPTTHNHLANSVEFNSGQSLSLGHGVDTNIEFAHIPIFPTKLNIATTAPLAIHCWVKVDATALIRSRIIQTPALGVNGVTRQFMLGLLGDNTFFGTSFNALRVGFGHEAGGATHQATVEPVIRPDTWHHIVFNSQPIGEPIVADIYVDGCKQDTIAVTNLDYTLTTNTGGTTPSGLVVGWDPRLDAPFKGKIASLAIFNRLLTDEEIETLAQGPCNLIGTSFNLKSALFMWWKMGDGDPVGLATLNDSVGTDHLTTVQMSAANLLTDVPKEQPRQHQELHLSTGCDEFEIDPNGVGCPFLWDSFRTIDGPDTVPRGWFGNKNILDKFERVMIAGRISVLRLAKNSTSDHMFMTNVDTTATGGTILFGHPAHPDPTEYCMETVVRNTGSGGEPPDDNLYMGFVEAPHSVTAAQPATGVFFHWDGGGNDIRVIVVNDNEVSTTTSFSLTTNTFYRIKVCFSYHSDLVQTANLRARLYVDKVLRGTVNVLSNSASYPAGNGEVFIGTETSMGTHNIDISWVSVSFRGIGSDNVLGI